MPERMLKVNLEAIEPAEWRGDCLAIGLYQGRGPQKAASRCGSAVERLAARALEEKWTTGKVGQTLTLPMPDGAAVKAERLMLVGLGKRGEITPETLRRAGGALNGAAAQAGVRSLLCLISADRHRIKRRAGAEALAEGALLGSYRFEEYRKESEEKGKTRLKKLTLLIRPNDQERLAGRLDQVAAIARGVFLARDLANHPGNVVNPDYLVRQARGLAGRLPIKTTVMDEKALKQAGMNGILAVGQGSVNPPRLIIMEYRKGGDQPPLAVVGKAVTFDTGGISLKPAARMEEMKYDMSGGAAVFGFMQAIAEMGLPINAVGLVPTAENMPSGAAQRPGDVIEMANGLFVEVINTDAEGRLILGDALHHAETFEPRAVIDLATLTGACVIALGNQACGLLGNDDALIRDLTRAGGRAGERAWALPLFKEYQEQLKSGIADLKNVGDRGAGTITAACFLSRFVGKGRPWAHLDIAGMAWEHSGRPHVPKGSAGFGVRLLSRYVLKHLT